MQKRWKTRRTLVASIGMMLAVVLVLSGRGNYSAAADTSQTLWGTSSPAGARTADNDTSSVELGTAFSVHKSGTITGIRYWRDSAQPDKQPGALWTKAGELIASASFPASSRSGWQTASFGTAVKVKAGESFVVSYHAPNGKYAFTSNYSGSSASPDLAIPGNDAGRYVYSSSTRFPTRSFQSTNYWVTPVFIPADDASSPPPPSTPTSPTSTPTPTATSTPASSGAKPGPSNTGVPAGTALKPYTGPHTITTAGTVIDSKDVTGALVIRAKNVVIRNSKIHDDPQAVAGVYTDGGSVTITDSEIYNFEVGITYSNWTAIRVNIHDTSSDGMKISSNTRLQDSWVHKPKPSSGAHWDGGQVQNGVTNTVIQGNFIDASGADTNSALFLCPDLGPSTNGPLTVTRNWLNGGNYTLFILDGANGKYFIRDISVTNNRFGRAGQYGPARVNVPVRWSGNVWDDTGKTISY
jgi:hypothetical protein